jgi:hypothetical protein
MAVYINIYVKLLLYTGGEGGIVAPIVEEEVRSW